MFMLLIAEEVPATSESVPLIGIYLTTVMTMTSVSVIMAVLVINLYNRGAKAKRAPKWLKVIVLNWICRFLRMTHDIERIAQSIRLKEEEEEKYRCQKHTGKTNSNRRPSAARLDTTLSGNLENLGFESDATPTDPNKDKLSRRFSTISNQDMRPEEEQVWLKREDLQREESKSLMPPPLSGPSSQRKKSTGLAGLGLPGLGMTKSPPQAKGTDTIAKLVVAICRKEQALVSRKEMIVEWQTIATVIDRLLFWIFLMATVLSYVIVLLVIPYVSKGYTKAFKDKGPSYVLME
ncbi:DgyrCDS1336 [Dimorphilus gyrociliatus]|uniref:DgyrCDS1336 n=1 Tax=Dimorphilus gyrociliatus TaxID=2664684 RepID=A0A7I8V6Y8_9ANNE|nr:DgyrCDS1336 [Dimorphilus gyrociliatus]